MDPERVEVVSVPITDLTGDPSKLRALIRCPFIPSPEVRHRIQEDVQRWFSGESRTLVLPGGIDLSFVLLDDPEPIIVEAK